jgi:hypothetical protein
LCLGTGTSGLQGASVLDNPLQKLSVLRRRERTHDHSGPDKPFSELAVYREQCMYRLLFCKISRMLNDDFQRLRVSDLYVDHSALEF